MRIFKNTIKVCSFIITIFILLDISIFRGFFTIHSIPSNCKLKYEYSIKKLPNQNFRFQFKNKSLLPFYIWTYKNNALLQEVSDSIFFNYATRFKISLPSDVYQSQNIFNEIKDYYYGVDCGTGLGETLIKPLEKFDLTLNYEQLLHKSSWNIRIWNHIDYVSTDVLNNERIYSSTQKYALTDSQNILPTDSLEFEFYLPAFCLFTRNPSYAASNKIKISYLDLLKYDVKRYWRIKKILEERDSKE